LDQLEIDIRKAPSKEVLDELIADAKALHFRWQDVLKVANRAGKCWIDGELKMRAEIELVKAKGTRGQLQGKQIGTSRGKGRGKGSSSGNTKTASPEEKTYKKIGINPKQAARALKLVELAETGNLPRIIKELAAADKPVNPNTVLARGRAEAK